MTIRSTTIDSVPRSEYVPTADQRVALYGLSWDKFESFLALRGETGPRVTYLRGTLELTSPSTDHENIKKTLAVIIQEYLDHAGIPHVPVEAWLLKHDGEQVGIEPDDCYLLHDRNKSRPDLAIEIIWTSGGIDKLDPYARFGVPEVWFWKDGAITFYVLAGDRYEERAQSACLPSFDRELAYELLQYEFVNDVRRVLRARLG